MILKNISLLNFKNIEQAELNMSHKLNCFIGNNGVGKTNILDAIYYLSFCRSAFSQSNQYVVRHDQDTMIVQGIYGTPDGEALNIYCGLKIGRRKSFRKNGKEYKKISDHIGLIPLVMVSPDDSDFIRGASDCRRKFMDITISQYSHTYLQELIKYNQILLQRNTLLKSDVMPDETILTAYDQMLGNSAQRIYVERKKFTNKIITTFNEIYSILGNTDEHVALEYHSHLDNDDLFSILQKNHQKDHIVGHTLYGIHRDNLEMTLNGHTLRYEGSQGQTKSFLIALRLAQYIYLKNTVKDRTPLLLLDDIFDKLDDERVERIIHIVSSKDYGQIFITSTNSKALEKVIKQSACDYKIFKVNNGNYEES